MRDDFRLACQAIPLVRKHKPQLNLRRLQCDYKEVRGYMSQPTTQDQVKNIEAVLTRRLHLDSPRFLLEPAGAKISGSVVSQTFRSKRDSERQQMLWDALDAEYGPESVRRAGTLLAFTPEEWDIG